MSNENKENTDQQKNEDLELNSETSEKEFNRELDLIKMYEKTDMKFIYFSSVTIKSDTKYFEHKNRMEIFIKKS